MAIRSFIVLVLIAPAVVGQEGHELGSQQTPQPQVSLTPLPPNEGLQPPEPVIRTVSDESLQPPEPPMTDLEHSAEPIQPPEAVPDSESKLNCQPKCHGHRVHVRRSRLAQWWNCRAEPCLRESHWGYPEYFNERPLGTYTLGYLHAQTMNGRIGQQVLYQYDFVDQSIGNAAELNSRGRDQLSKLVPIMMQTGYPLVVQRTEDPQLDEARRELILQQLAELEVEVTDDMVVVRRVPVVGIGGIGEHDFPTSQGWNVIYENRLLETRERGSRRLLPDIGGLSRGSQ